MGLALPSSRADLAARLDALPERVRPRFVTLRLDARREAGGRAVRLRWAVPLWAFEEALAFALRAAPLAAALAPRLRGRVPARWRPALDALTTLRPAAARLPALFDDLFDDAAGLLALPPGEPFLSVETADVRLEIGCW